MRKYGRIILALLCALCLLPAAGGFAAPDIRTARTNLGRIEQGSIAMMGELTLVPEDCSGFELQARPDQAEALGGLFPGLPAPEAAGDSGMLRVPLDAETAFRLLDSGYAASIGPDSSVLWIMYTDTRAFWAVQHGRTLVLASQAEGRGAPDTDGALKDTLDRKLRLTQAVEGEACWSPDARWVFFNDTDRWTGEGMKLNDPYLLDTRTGEIFLLESSGSPKDPMRGTFRCVMNGSFSLDGKSLYWYCRSYEAGAVTAHLLMRYDLESGAQETVCELEGAMSDFCEIAENKWLLVENAGGETRLVRLALSPEGAGRTAEPLPSFCSSAVFMPAVRGKVLLAATPRPSGGTFLLPLAWDAPADPGAWRKIGGIHDGELQAITVDEITTALEEAAKAKTILSGGENINNAYVKHTAAMIGTEDLLLTIFIREPVPASWGGGFRDFSGQVILNTDTLKLYAIETGGLLDGLKDTLIDANCFLAQNYSQAAMFLYSAYTLPETEFLQGETYASPYGVFMCRNDDNPLVLTSVTLENRAYTADIIIMEEGRYTICFRVTDYPEPEAVRQEYIVPEILTADRWAEVTGAMNKKDQKKFSGIYTKIAPDKLAERADRDEILASYPTAAGEALYVLLDNQKAANLATAEAALQAAGYTAEDYARDMEPVAAPRETNVSVTKSGKARTSPVRYTYAVTEPRLNPTANRVLELACLCDMIGRDVLANRVLPEPQPVESVILDRYSLGTVDFSVTIDTLESSGDSLVFDLTVTPDQ